MLFPGSTPAPSRVIHSTSITYRRWQGCSSQSGGSSRGGSAAGFGRWRGVTISLARKVESCASPWAGQCCRSLER